MKRICFVTAAIAVFSAGCGGERMVSPTSSSAVLFSVTVTSTPVSASTTQLTATARYSDSSSRDVTSVASWESSDATIATVSTTGLVTALKSGTVEIGATFEQVRGIIRLSFGVTPSGPVYVISGLVYEAPPNNTFPIQFAKVEIADGPNAGKSAMTDRDGRYALTGIEPGTATLRATKPDYETAEHAVTVAGDTRYDFSLRPEPQAPSPLTVVISEFRTRGPKGVSDEFIELRNDAASPVDIGGWRIAASSSVGSLDLVGIMPSGVTLGPGCRYLITNSTAYSGTTAGDLTSVVGLMDDGGLALLRADSSYSDRVGMSLGSAFREGVPLAPFNQSADDRSYARNGPDTNDNGRDFSPLSPSNPQNRGSTCSGK